MATEAQLPLGRLGSTGSPSQWVCRKGATADRCVLHREAKVAGFSTTSNQNPYFFAGPCPSKAISRLQPQHQASSRSPQRGDGIKNECKPACCREQRVKEIGCRKSLAKDCTVRERHVCRIHTADAAWEQLTAYRCSNGRRGKDFSMASADIPHPSTFSALK